MRSAFSMPNAAGPSNRSPCFRVNRFVPLRSMLPRMMALAWSDFSTAMTSQFSKFRSTVMPTQPLPEQRSSTLAGRPSEWNCFKYCSAMSTSSSVSGRGMRTPSLTVNERL